MAQLGWIDFSRNHYNKVMEVMDMFKEQGAVDELGIGSIRDAFSELLFPGTSTIQTRAKYFFIVPWIIQEVEKKDKFKGKLFIKEIEEIEIEVLKALNENCKQNELGIIGRRSIRNNKAPKRKPSSIYWNGLRTYEILNFKGSLSEFAVQNQFQKSVTNTYAFATKEDADPEDSLTDAQENNSFFRISSANKDWKKKITINLTKEEADFLKNKIITSKSCKDSLFEFMLNENIKEAVDFDSIQDFLSVSNLPKHLVEQINMALQFNFLMKGAIIRYNYLLFSSLDNESLELYKLSKEFWNNYLEELKGFDWNSFTQSFLTDLEMYFIKSGKQINIPISTKKFAGDWIALLKEKEYNPIKGDELIKDRERLLKSYKRAKLFDKSLAQKQISFSGITYNVTTNEVYYLSYRWERAKQFFIDIQNGINNA